MTGCLLVNLAYLLSAALSVYAWQLPQPAIQSRRTARPTTSLQAGQQNHILDFFQKDKDTFNSVEDFDEDLAAEINDALLSAGVDGILHSTAESSSDEQTTISAVASISETSSSDETLVNSEKQIPDTPIQTEAPKVDKTPPHTSLAQVIANQLSIDLSLVTPSNGGKISASDVEYYAWKLAQPPSTPEALARAYQLGLDLNILYDDEDREYVMQLSDVQLYEENSRSLRALSQRRRGAPTNVNTKTKQRTKKLNTIDERMEKRMELLKKKLGNVADGISKTVKLPTPGDLDLALVKIEKKDEQEINSVQDFDSALAIEIQEALMSAGLVDDINGNEIGSDESLQSINDVVAELDAEPTDKDFDATLAVEIQEDSPDSDTKSDSHAQNLEVDKPESIYGVESDANEELEIIQSIGHIDTSAEAELQIIHKSMTVAEIKEELEIHGIKSRGKKSELAKRLHTLKSLQSKTVDQLKQDLRRQGLKVSGKKAELVQRLIYARENEKKTDSSLFFVDMQ